MSGFAERSKILRVEKHLTQTELAKMLDISQTAISAYELGRNKPTDDVIVSYCKFFKVSADYILGLIE